jgi:hypothetical protein
MPSPFPGMDPYLEEPARWTDVHQRLITYIADALQPQVRPRYHARMGERVYILTPPQTMYPDVLLVQRPLREPELANVGLATPQADAAAEASTPGSDEAPALSPDEAPLDTPIVLTFPPAEHREPFVEIVHTAGDEVVAVIEVLSPANKTAGEGHRLYRHKQQALLDSPAHLIEIDLLSQGLPTVALPEEARASLPPHRYLVSVQRAPEQYRFELYPIPLEGRLPRLRVPLREPDPDVGLDLGAVLTRCYDNGGYADLTDYRQPPPVALSEEEAAWLDSLLKEKGLRP